MTPDNMLAYLLGCAALESTPDSVDTYNLSQHPNADAKVAICEQWGELLIKVLDERGIVVRYR